MLLFLIHIILSLFKISYHSNRRFLLKDVTKFDLTPLQYYSIQPDIVRYCSSLIFLSSGASFDEGV